MVSTGLKVQFGHLQSLVIPSPDQEAIMPAECLWYTEKEIRIFRGEFRGEMMAEESKSDRFYQNDFTKGNVGRQNYIQSILALQRDHQELGINDTKGLAALSLTLTKAHKKEAKQKGLNDSAEVYGSVRGAPLRRCVSNDERTLSRLRASRNNSSSSAGTSDNTRKELPRKSKSFNEKRSQVKDDDTKKKVKKTDRAPRRIIRRMVSSDSDQLYEMRKTMCTKTDRAPRRVPRRSDSEDLTDMATPSNPREATVRSSDKEEDEVVENLYLSRMRNAPQRQNSRSGSPQRCLSMSSGSSRRRLSASSQPGLSRSVSRTSDRRGRSRSKSPQRRLGVSSGSGSFSSFGCHRSTTTSATRRNGRRSKSPQRSLGTTRSFSGVSSSVATSTRNTKSSHSQASRQPPKEMELNEERACSPIPSPRKINIASLAA